MKNLSGFTTIISFRGVISSEVVIIVAERERATAPLTRVPETSVLLRPYAAQFTFNTTLAVVPILNHDVSLQATVTDPLLETQGYDRAKFTVLATNNRATRTTDDIDYPIFSHQEFSHSLQFNAMLDRCSPQRLDYHLLFH